MEMEIFGKTINPTGGDGTTTTTYIVASPFIQRFSSILKTCYRSSLTQIMQDLAFKTKVILLHGNVVRTFRKENDESRY